MQTECLKLQVLKNMCCKFTIVCTEQILKSLPQHVYFEALLVEETITCAFFRLYYFLTPSNTVANMAEKNQSKLKWCMNSLVLFHMRLWINRTYAGEIFTEATTTWGKEMLTLSNCLGTSLHIYSDTSKLDTKSKALVRSTTGKGVLAWAHISSPPAILG